MKREEKLKALPPLLLAWYDKNKRDLPWRRDADPYRVWVSEIMLQQTRVEAARDYYIRFLHELPAVGDLAACPEEKLLKLWEGLGYYSRAKNMQKAAREILSLGGFPDTAEKLQKLPGIGQYTAGAIASIAFGKPSPAVDGNVVRVLSRILGDAEEQPLLRKKYFAELVPAYPEGRAGDFTQSLMELGATVCLPSSPKCLLCPVRELCQTQSDALPLKAAKPERKKTDMTVFVFYDRGGIWLEKRAGGVLSGMMQFYNAEHALTPEAAARFLSEKGLTDFCLGEPKAHRHVFTHLIWEMTAYPVRVRADLSALSAFSSLRFFTAKQAEGDVSLPSAFRWCLSLIPEK